MKKTNRPASRIQAQVLSVKESQNSHLFPDHNLITHLSGHHGAEGDDTPGSDGGVTQQQRPQDRGGDIWQIQI